MLTIRPTDATLRTSCAAHEMSAICPSVTISRKIRVDGAVPLSLR
jgi:hypothetical protein